MKLEVPLNMYRNQCERIHTLLHWEGDTSSSNNGIAIASLLDGAPYCNVVFCNTTKWRNSMFLQNHNDITITLQYYVG
jgi:hypothetical protein